MQYRITREECQKTCDGMVCSTCGFPLSPFETVDNSSNPTHWPGCEHCQKFNYGVPHEVYKKAAAIKKDFYNVSIEDMCSIVWRLDTDAKAIEDERDGYRNGQQQLQNTLSTVMDSNAKWANDYKKLEAENQRLRAFWEWSRLADKMTFEQYHWKEASHEGDERRTAMSKKYRKKPVVIEAEQWFVVTYDRGAGHGIEPEDMPIYHLNVGYYRTPTCDGQDACQHCGQIMHNHGWIDTLEGGHIVCPGDWVITGIKGEQYPCKPDIFEATYDPVEGGQP